MRFSEIKNHKESIGLLFWQVSMLWQRKIKKVLQAYDLTHTQFVILAVIEELTEQGKVVTQKNISDFSMIDVMTISSSVRLLAKKGLISRSQHETDTRANSIVNTDMGKSLLSKAVKAVDKIDKTFFFDCDANRILHSTLSELLHKNQDTIS